VHFAQPGLAAFFHCDHIMIMQPESRLNGVCNSDRICSANIKSAHVWVYFCVSDVAIPFSDTMRNIAMLGDRGLSNSSDICSSSQGLHENIQACISDA
jgi:hypothetical protein